MTSYILTPAQFLSVDRFDSPNADIARIWYTAMFHSMPRTVQLFRTLLVTTANFLHMQMKFFYGL